MFVDIAAGKQGGMSLDKTSAAKIPKMLGNDNFYIALQIDTWRKQGVDRDTFAMAPIRLLMEGRGIPMETWFTDLAQPTYRISTGGGDALNWIDGLIRNDSELLKMKSSLLVEGEAADQVCNELKIKSLRATRNLFVARLPVEPMSNCPATFSKVCAQCHSDPQETLAPPIPFYRPEQMKDLLRTGLREHIWERIHSPEGEQMPPTLILNRRQKEEIRRCLGR